MTREYVQLSTFMALEYDYHDIRALLCNLDWIFARQVCEWNPQPLVLLCNNTTTDPCLMSTNGMKIGATAHQSAYLQSASFLHARRLLMHDLDMPSDEAAKRCLCTDPDVEPESLNVCLETP